MIQAQDLRIGNWVNYHHQVDGIIPIQIEPRHFSLCLNHNDKFNLVHSPIPITPERLERMGFAIDKANYKGETVYVKGKFMLIESGDLIVINGWLDEENLTYSGYEVNDADNRYRFIHQLQNLFHALTGKELINQ